MKPTLKYTLKRVISVQDWNKFVREVYGRPYHFQQQEGCKSRGTFDFTAPEEEWNDAESDTVPEIINHDDMCVSFAAWLARDPKQPLNGLGDPTDYEAGEVTTEQWDIDLWWERNFYPDVSMIINDLHAKGLLEAGDYTIDIDW